MEPRTEASPGAVHSTAADRHYFACRIRRFLTMTAAGIRDANAYPADLRRRHVEFLTCLLNPRDERLTYDLRLIARPDPDLAARGTIAVALLCRMDGATAEEARRHADQLLDLLEAYFPEHEFELADAAAVPGLLAPFRPGGIARITRRIAREPLDTLRAGRALPGRRAAAEEDPATEPPLQASEVLHAFPFLPTTAPLHALFRFLLLEASPVAVSVRIRPTALRPGEEEFFERQIATCERYAQMRIGEVLDERNAGDLSWLRPTLQEHARLYQRFLGRLLSALRDNAGLLAVEVASPAAVPSLVAEAVGAAITEPAGGYPPGDGDYRHLAGGYEVVDVGAAPDRVAAFEGLEPEPLPHPMVPAEARRIPHLFDAGEAAGAFRFAPAALEPPPGVNARSWREHPAPAELADAGVLLGVSVERGMARPVRIAPDDRRRHVYAVGQTGTGKSTLLKTMILDDIEAGEGLCVVDPHGDLFRELLGRIPERRLDDVVLLDPTDVDHPVGLNLLEHETEAQRYFIVQEFTGIIARLMHDDYSTQGASMTGPVFYKHMRMNMLLAMSNPEDPGTLFEFYNIFSEGEYWKRWLPLRTSDPLLRRWVEHGLPRSDYPRPANDGMSMGDYISSKFESFIFDPMLRNIFAQKRSTLDLRRIMDEGKILLVNLAKGELTEPNSRFFGMILLAKLQAAAMARTNTPQEQRRVFHVYVDEFQSIATQSFITMLSEARKFGLSLVLANQFVSQISDERIAGAIFGNVGTLVCFRLGQADAELMERELFPVFDRHDLINLPNWHAYVSTLVGGQAVRPFALETILHPATFDAARAERLRSLCRPRYGRRREEVEAQVLRSTAGGEAG